MWSAAIVALQHTHVQDFDVKVAMSKTKRNSPLSESDRGGFSLYVSKCAFPSHTMDGQDGRTGRTDRRTDGRTGRDGRLASKFDHKSMSTFDSLLGAKIGALTLTYIPIDW